MWIYEPDAPLANHTAPDAAERSLLPVPACDANTFENEAPQEAPGTVQPEVHATAPAAPVPARRGAAQAFPGSGMLAAAFLAGSAAAGVLYALCNAPQLEWLRAYLQSWLALFSASGTHAAAAIFAAEYITLLAAATCLFLLGFSAFGPVLIVLFMMLYGAGNGILTVQLFSGTSLGGKALLLLLTAVPACSGGLPVPSGRGGSACQRPHPGILFPDSASRCGTPGRGSVIPPVPADARSLFALVWGGSRSGLPGKQAVLNKTQLLFLQEEPQCATIMKNIM